MNIVIEWQNLIEIGLIAIIFYYSFLFLRGTRAYQVLKGLIILLVIFVLAKQLELTTITFILSKIFGVAILAFVILFQPELRRAFAALGRTRFYSSLQEGEDVTDILAEGVALLSEKEVGALIAISRENSLGAYIDTGMKLDAVLSVEILVTIFSPRTPLHDGAVILDGNRIIAASCLLPLSQRSGLKQSYGTRHRAGIGLTEETDALVIVVSEETGKVSVASGGKIQTMDIPALKRKLKASLYREESKQKSVRKSFIKRYFSSGVKSS